VPIEGAWVFRPRPFSISALLCYDVIKADKEIPWPHNTLVLLVN
jgi:hypothetical protein